MQFKKVLNCFILINVVDYASVYLKLVRFICFFGGFNGYTEKEKNFCRKDCVIRS